MKICVLNGETFHAAPAPILPAGGAAGYLFRRECANIYCNIKHAYCLTLLGTEVLRHIQKDMYKKIHYSSIHQQESGKINYSAFIQWHTIEYVK